MVKQIIVEQIIRDLENGKSSETLHKVLESSNNDFLFKCLDELSLQIIEKSKPDFELKKGMRIRAKLNLRGKSCNWNSPEMIDIPAGAIVEVNDNASNGDLFVCLIEGVCIQHRRDSKEPTLELHPKEDVRHDMLRQKFILIDGKNSRHPYDWGIAEKSCWEILT
jgi:hypothetical protein